MKKLLFLNAIILMLPPPIAAADLGTYPSLFVAGSFFARAIAFIKSIFS